MSDKFIQINGRNFNSKVVAVWSKYNDTALLAVEKKFNITRNQINEAITEYAQSKPEKTVTFSQLQRAIQAVEMHNQAVEFTAYLNAVYQNTLECPEPLKTAITTFIDCTRKEVDGRGMFIPFTNLPARMNPDGLLAVYWGNWVKQSGIDSDKRYYYNTRVNPNAQDDALDVMMHDRAFLTLFPQFNQPKYLEAYPKIKDMVLRGGIFSYNPEPVTTEPETTKNKKNRNK